MAARWTRIESMEPSRVGPGSGARARARDAAAVISLHSLDLLDRGFDRVVALRDGRVAWQGDPAGVDQATLRDVYGADYERVLGDEAPAR